MKDFKVYIKIQYRLLTSTVHHIVRVFFTQPSNYTIADTLVSPSYLKPARWAEIIIIIIIIIIILGTGQILRKALYM